MTPSARYCLREFDELGVELGGQHPVVADVRVRLDRRAVVILEVVVHGLGAVEPIHLQVAPQRGDAADSIAQQPGDIAFATP